MKRNFHLIGEAKQHTVDRLMESILVYEEIVDVVYNEEFRDLEVESDYDDVGDIINQCIDDLHLSLRVVERKAYQKDVFEKRYFRLTNLTKDEDQKFIQSYFSNDETVESTRYNTVENVLTIVTSDPFIFNKLNYVVKGLDEGIEVEEIFSKDKFINLAFMIKLIAVVLFVMFTALVLVTRKDPSIVTEIGWVGMYAILVYYHAAQLYEHIRAKKYFNYSLVVIVTTYVMLMINYHAQAIAGLLFGLIADMAYRIIRSQYSNRLIDFANGLVGQVRCHQDDAYVDVGVEYVSNNDVVLYDEGSIIHFDGIVLEGEADLDTCLMTGEEELQHVTMNQSVESGSIVKKGGIEIKVTTPYYSTALYRLYRFNPKELHQHGYLEDQSRKKDLIVALGMVILGFIVMIAGYLLSDYGRLHFIMSGLVLMYLCYPLGMLRLRPLFYQALKQISLKKNVAFLNEEAVNRFMEVCQKKEVKYEDDDKIHYHHGGYNNLSVIKNYNVIYDDTEGLDFAKSLAHRCVELWKNNRLIMMGCKVILSALFMLGIFNFYFALFVNLVINAIIIYRCYRVFNMVS